MKGLLEGDPFIWSKELVGELVDSGFSTDSITLRSYEASIIALKDALFELKKIIPSSIKWHLLFEFQLLRRQKRLDVVILAHDRIIVVEFKTGTSGGGRDAQTQVEDYAFNLRDFHEPSNGRLIVPIIVGGKSPEDPRDIVRLAGSYVSATVAVRPSGLLAVLARIAELENPFNSSPIDPDVWERGRYFPVPSILEAALHLFRTHDVRDIASCSAGSDNLELTVGAIREVISQARVRKQRTICFVTGVPGSGKTLAGLTAVHAGDEGGEHGDATFLSGNIPLVKVLREALIRDAVKIDKKKRSDAERHVHAFVEPMQGFVAEYGVGDTNNAPNNRVVIFDEAQRAWDRDRMSHKKGIEQSEPEILLNIMGRHEDAVLIALVGGGQEIHKGEAGLKGWGEALKADPRWKILASPEMIEGLDEAGGSKIFPQGLPNGIDLIKHSSLHLAIDRRSIKSANWNQWVESFLRGDLEHARSIAATLEGFDVMVTRSLAQARSWLRSRSKGSRRCGLVSSSGNLRGRAFGIEVSSSFKGGIDWPSWFLNGKQDIRSSSYLEIPATEFECQGLEIDEVGLCWGGDFLPEVTGGSWTYKNFRGTRWVNVGENDRRFIMSKYRVLLTRARTGIVIWVPSLVGHDITVDVRGFDLLYETLIQAGISPI